MNYVNHTRAAHERLSQRPEARPHHVSLYWALFFEWNTARFPQSLPLNRDELMRAAHIGNKDTLTATIRTLETFALLTYQPSHSAGNSRVVMARLGAPVAPEVRQPAAGSSPGTGAAEVGEVAPEVGQPVTPEVGQPKPEVTPEVGQHSFISKTVSVNSKVNGGGTQKKEGEKFPGEGLSEVQVLDDDTAPLTPDRPAQARKGAAPPAGQVAPKKKGPREAAIGAAATAQANQGAKPTRGRTHKPETTFDRSDIYDHARFAAAFEGTDYALADLRHYHELINLWRDKTTGEPPRRADWVACAKRFMFNDATENRLKLAPGTTRVGPADAGQQNPGGPATGYRSSRWD